MNGWMEYHSLLSIYDYFATPCFDCKENLQFWADQKQHTASSSSTVLIISPIPLWTRHWCSICLISSSLRIRSKGIWHPALRGHRQRPGFQAAAGCPEGEPARLPGPGGQRAAVQGWEEAVLQRQQAAGQLRVHPRWRTGLSGGKLCSAGARRPQQAAVTSTCRQHWSTEEGKTLPPPHRLDFSLQNWAGH